MATAAACSAEQQKYKITEQPPTASAFVPREKQQTVCSVCATSPLDLLWSAFTHTLLSASFSALLRIVHRYTLTADTGTPGKLPVCLLCMKNFAKKTPKLSLSLPPWTRATKKSNQSRERRTSSTFPHHGVRQVTMLTLIAPLLLSILSPVGNNPNQNCRKEDR